MAISTDAPWSRFGRVVFRIGRKHRPSGPCALLRLHGRGGQRSQQRFIRSRPDVLAHPGCSNLGSDICFPSFRGKCDRGDIALPRRTDVGRPFVMLMNDGSLSGSPPISCYARGSQWAISPHIQNVGCGFARSFDCMAFPRMATERMR